ncbi:MAG: 16S rRNA (cytidine(1402)-2'-O)-methyltransferase [candidate division WOR-3 bacterium]|nr:16S rRNA (cytidine(1402)-2'-O)-methyltransferase [candidate division WOR-3 bacterium]MCX7836735.1 16S rRNA (cytidine(1402)-2'-O)-methyltransferase [candidate division WOR-3 bacterium]MDW8113370.1 16S rRNA (cytidine(1402)-2'-O)-methyltransferase [candidate division WOR-3 bacterium]
MSGTLYLVATPIGNLKDITLRALEILKEVSYIVCEDTQQTKILLDHYQIKKPLISYNEYNKFTKTPKLIQLLKEEKDLAFVSDAGTPVISDPGYYLVREAIKEGIKVSPIPGPVAMIAGLIVSGLPSDRFVFEGFLPKREGRKRKKLLNLINEERTIIFYESPYRIMKTLNTLLEILGDREIALCRELTKKFEEVLRGKISEIIEILKKRLEKEKRIKGEIVLIVKGKEE